MCPNLCLQTFKNLALNYLTHARISAPKRVERDVKLLVTRGMWEPTNKSGNEGDRFATQPEFSLNYQMGQLSVRSGSGYGAPSAVHWPRGT